MTQHVDRLGDLRQAREQRRLVVVVGSGVSFGATGKNPITTWKGLIENGIERCRARGLKTKSAEAALAEGDLILAAQAVSRQLAPTNDLGPWLRAALETLKIADRSSLDAIGRLAAGGIPIATTNYDNLLEDATNRQRLTWRQNEQFEAWLRGGARTIQHLHGHYLDPDSVVLGDDSYARVVSDGAARSNLEGLIKSHTLLFLGCGEGGLSDPNFGSILEWIDRTFPRGTGFKHVRVVPDADVEHAREFHRARHHPIEVLSCGPGWEALPGFLDQIEARTSKPTGPIAATTFENAALAAYRAWALPYYRKVELIGLGAADIDLDLHGIYVPLRIADRGDREIMNADRRIPAGEDGTREPFGIEDLFTQHRSDAITVALGEPGTGKTTAGKKLLVGLLESEAPWPGLAARTVPVFVRLRSIQPDDLGADVGSFIDRELRAQGCVNLPDRFGTELWEHGNLLLIADGFDEVATDELRERCAKWLEEQVRAASERGIRAFVSSRDTSYDERCRFSDRAVVVHIQKLDDAQQVALVSRWYGACEDKAPDGPARTALRAERDRLLESLKDPAQRSQKLLVLLSTPLLLNLLCIHYRRGRDLPRSKAAFFANGLEVLLWTRPREKGQEPPLDFPLLRSLCAAVAFEQHRAVPQADFTSPRFKLWADAALRGSGTTTDLRKLLKWLREVGGLLAETAPGSYAFAHAQFREYLAALHASDRELGALLAEHAGDPRWDEVVSLFFEVAAPDRLGVLLGHAMSLPDFGTSAGSNRHKTLMAGLAGPCVVDPTVFVIALERSPPNWGHAQAALELARTRLTSEVLEAAKRLTKHRNCPQRIKSLVGFLIQDWRARQQPEGSKDLFLAFADVDRTAVESVVRALEEKGFGAWPTPALRDADSSWRKKVAALEDVTRAGLVLFGSSVDSLAADGYSLPLLELLHKNGRQVGIVLLEKGRARPKLPGLPGDLPLLPKSRHGDLEAFCNGLLELRASEGPDRATAGGIERLPGEAARSAGVAGDRPAAEAAPIVDSELGLRLLHVPGGEFEMGMEIPKEVVDSWPKERREEFRRWHLPVHRVRVSPFFLGATSVTNAQYARFLKESGAKEPEKWRDRNFSAPEQPVVGVSWDEAKAFCIWLGERLGRECFLPSEAQREFATRPDGRPYAWGQKPPDDARAVFGKDWNDGPAPVGSKPLGRGQFGHDDLAGNVWEWCADAWSPNAYEARAQTVATDPLVADAEGDASVSAVRGGAFGDPAGDLLAALRDWYHRENRFQFLGFRVAAAAKP